MPTTISGSNGVTFPNASTSTVGGVGDGQTWQDVTASRAINTTYTNSTGKPIFVSVTVSNTANGNGQASLNISGITVARARFAASASSGANVSTVTGIVPNGESYLITDTSTLNLVIWAELR